MDAATNLANIINGHAFIEDTRKLVYLFNRAGWNTSFNLIMPSWEEIISTGSLKLIHNDVLKSKIAALRSSSEGVNNIRLALYTDVVRQFQDERARYYDVSSSLSYTGGGEPGLTPSSNTYIDIEDILHNKELIFQLRRVYRAVNEYKSLLNGQVKNKLEEIYELIDSELNSKNGGLY